MKLEPPVEPVAEFGQIAGEMFLPNGMVGPVDRVLDVAQQSVDPEELGTLDAVRSAPCDERLMAATRPGQFPEGGEAVGHHDATGGPVFLDPRGDLDPGEPPDPGQAKAHGTTVLGAGDRRQERGLSGSAPSPLAAAPFPAPVGVIDLDGTVQRAFVIPLLHHLEDFVLQEPSGVVGNSQLPREFQCADGVFALGQKGDPQEPDGQRQLGPGHDRPACEQGLAAAGVALISAVREHAELRTFADRALEPVRPAPSEESLAAVFLRSLLPVKLGKTEPFLELDPIFGHDVLPQFK